ncbi:MAG: ABC transporter ATP-binding protein [Armatimonadota bacterium]|nr:ABC transporter ATP-binding protein [Armatimonadota bacterium]
MAGHLRLVDVVKRFGAAVAVDGVTLDIEEGCFFTLLGPSGCGKTTLLRVVAGFHLPDRGEVYLRDRRITHLPPHARGTAMVFQEYALFPHMTVEENVAYGLRMRRVPAAAARERVRQVLELVGLVGQEHKYPHQLSGGQQQRVALARALVVEPEVLLLDEPLSNLDAKLRLRVREELRDLQRRLGQTTVYVTHDQEEALALSDRIAVMNAGRVLQLGTPEEVYLRPRNRFVAEFVGLANFVEGQWVGPGRVQAGRLELQVDDGGSSGRKVLLAVRPEEIRVRSGPPAGSPNALRGRVRSITFLGSVRRCTVETDGLQWVVDVQPDVRLQTAQEVYLEVPPHRLRVVEEG